MKIKNFKAILIGFAFLALSFTEVSAAENAGIQKVTAISEVFGDGEKVSTVVLEYDKTISPKSLSADDYTVTDKTITTVCTNTAPEATDACVPGPYVIISLDTSRQPLAMDSGASNQQPPDQPSDGTQQPGGPQGGPGMGMSASLPDTSASVTQTGEVDALDGTVYAGSDQVYQSTAEIHKIVDDFQQLTFTDPSNGATMAYNLYIPQNYDASQKYPLVNFMADASATGEDPLLSLTQGNGGVIWASPEEQAKHPCFVLVPQFSVAEVNDNFETDPILDEVPAIIYALEAKYSIDINRIYTTGQSGGCMSSIALMIKYPDLFAASMLVAGQWNPETMTSLVNDKMWILVAEGDLKAYPGMNTSLTAMEAAGAKVTRGVWDAKASDEELTQDAKTMEADGNSILYTVFQKGSVLPEGMETAQTEHMYTWQVAYNITAVRDWLFSQAKG